MPNVRHCVGSRHCSQSGVNGGLWVESSLLALIGPVALPELTPRKAAGEFALVKGNTDAAIWGVSCRVIPMFTFIVHPISINSLGKTLQF